MDLSEIFWSCSFDELKRGYINKGDQYICICCGKTFEQGLIYQIDDFYMDAKKATEHHLKIDHDSMFSYLLNMDKKYTNLTDNQKNLLNYFYQGLSDKDIVKQVGGSASTIRNQRFSLREKAKSAKIFLSIMELFEEKIKSEDKFITIHTNATQIDERYAITEKERETFIKTYFKGNQLISFPKKQKRIIIILQEILKCFEKGKIYSEKEVNYQLKEIYADYVTLRRYLIEYGFLDRKPDGSEYWIK